MSRRDATRVPDPESLRGSAGNSKRRIPLTLQHLAGIVALLLLVPLVAPVGQAFFSEWQSRLSSLAADPGGQPAPGNWRQQLKAEENGWFGYSVALAGDTFVSGAKMDDARVVGAGAAYVYRRQGAAWVPQAQLLPPAGTPEDAFGHSVDIDGTTIVVGAYGDDAGGPDVGAAYLFAEGTGGWEQRAQLLPGGGTPGDMFGYSVAVDGNLVVVGAPGDNKRAADAGAAYVFRFDGSAWNEEATLTAGAAASHDLFGASVAIAGNRVVVGAHEADTAGNASGAAYVFVYENGAWQEQALLVPDDGRAGDHFGESVATDGDVVLVGATGHGGQGAAYLFANPGTGWNMAGKLTPDDGQPGDAFGRSVGLSGGTALVGAPGHDGPGPDAGVAYAFSAGNGGWVQEQKLVADDASAHAGYGFSVALDGPVVALGIRGRNAVYLLERQ